MEPAISLIVWPSLLAASLVIVSLVLVFAAEVFAAFSLRPRLEAGRGARLGPIAVLVPAHNESSSLLPTLDDLKQQLRPEDRIVVVADNCTDDTAAVARSAGAQVIERVDPALIGKGYALDFGVRHLRAAPPEIVVIIDADCRVEPGALDLLAGQASALRRPIQACYVMVAPEGSPVSRQVAEFAWLVKNHIRPLGLHRLGLPCQLAGTGMAFPWELIEAADLASGSLVEDLELGQALARSGKAAAFCPAARVWSEFPTGESSARTQRSRWESGHLRLIRSHFWPALKSGIHKRDVGLIALALDLAVPPLSFLGVVLFFSLWLSGSVALLLQFWMPFVLSAFATLVYAAAIWLCWLRMGRNILPAGDLKAILPYALGKLGLYWRVLFSNADERWVRTGRESK